ncbi:MULTISPECIES: TonB-dependent receptor [Sphingomonas]|jgi:iron complex outermembrane receptor protein|nr:MULTISPECIES: TonB-dependent receptor [Sphingomonas]MBP2515187.1 iron complex outermembrane receptor protein [Sphingomonas sp. PvP018]MDY0968527.1 TonB-dependent receptor [Sphingomonas sp. CFBP9021]USR01654.1 TonB-dependent receptor [Sphingomonas aerolata]
MVFPKQMLLASTAVVASAIAGLIAPAGAQTAPSSAPPAAAEQPVSAQTPPTQAAPSGDADSDIVVTGIRGSLRSAIAVKREANAVVDVISAEAIGKFPDRNVAESLSHIPGVSIDRRFGEGEKVAILGTDPALNRMLLDGHALASADWGGNDNDPSSRTFNYSLLAPELVDRLEVYKSPEPRIEEGSLGGTVIVRTRRPLELKANSIFASGGYSYNDRSDKGNVRGSGLYSWKNDAETFGVLVAATYDKQSLTRAGVEFFGYDNAAANADGTYNSPFVNRAQDGTLSLKSPGATITGGTIADLYKAASPFGINYAYFQQTRERKSVSGTVQYRPSSELTLTLNGLHINGNYDNYSQSMYTIPGAWTGNVLQSANISNGVVNAATFGAATSQSAQLDTLVRKTKLTTDNLNLFADWEGDDGAKVSFAGGWSRARGGRNPEYLFNVQTRLPFSYAFTNDTATVNFTGDPTNPANYFTNPNNNPAQIEGSPVLVGGTQLNAAQIGGLDYSVTTDRDIFGGYDATIPVSFGPFTQLMLGARVTDHVNRIDGRGINTYLTTSQLASQLNVPTASTPDGTFSGSGGLGNATQYLNLSEQSVIDILANAINSPLIRKIGASTRVKETVAASYAQLNFEQSGFRGNIGGRLVYTKDVSDYALTLSTAANPNPVPTPTTTSTDYLKFLPSFNIAYEASSSLIFRGAVAKVISRPRYQDLAASISQNDTTRDAGGGNPNLKPYESTNYELTAEFYPRPGSLLAVEAFRRDISNYIITTRTEGVTLFNSLTGRLENNYSVSQPINGGKAKVNGILVSGQSEIWGGFGLQANYTYQDSTTSSTDASGADLNLPYLSKHTVNVIPYFESGPFQARLSYNYRTKYFRTIGRLGSREMVAAYNQLDLSAGFNLTKQVTLSLNAQNLLDETYRQYNATPDRPTAFYKNGRTYVASLSFRL